MTEYKGYYYNIIQDEYVESPDTWENTDLFLVYDHRQFCVERDGFDIDCIISYINPDGYLSFPSYIDYSNYYIFPVYAYIHSGVSLSLNSFSCNWDTSMRGFVLVDKNSFKNITDDKAKEYAEDLITTWNKYLSGEVYVYEIYKETKCDCCGHVEREFIECVGGYYGEDQCEQDAKGVIDNLNK